MSESAKAVFLSYSSQDADAARRICAALRAAGIEVWFDESELRGGDAWDASIRRQIRDCALFMPIISASTNARGEGYFRLEWRLAVERSQLMADDQAFLLPVVIDATPEASARVPDRFRERQWSRLQGGETPSAFIEHLRQVLSGVALLPATPLLMQSAPVTVAPRKRAWLVAIAALAAMAIASLITFKAWHGHVTDKAPVARVAAADTLAADLKSVAVLPFENLSGRAEDAYLADGLQEEILNALARLRDLKVISRTSVMEYRGRTHNVREISQRLGVRSILEGSIRRDGNTLRLTVQLIDARDDHHLLAANYDRDLAHVLNLQSAVARQVAEALAATLSAYERGELDRVGTNSGDAYNRYLRAVALYRQPVPEDETGLVEPKRLLEEALRLDPDYADALALLSQADTWTYFYSPRPADGDAARQAFERALAIDPQLPEAQLARGLYAMYVTADLDQALADLTAVVRLRPNAAGAHSALGLALRRRGRMTESLAHAVRAWDLDPLNHAYDGPPIVTLLGLRRYPEAIEQTTLYLKRFPNSPDGHLTRAHLESYLQHSVEPLRAALREHGNLFDPLYHKVIDAEIATAEGRYLDAVGLMNALLPWKSVDPVEIAERIGFLYLAAGDPQRAQQNFRTAERTARAMSPGKVLAGTDLAQLAMVQSMLGKHATALASIDLARTQNPEARDAINGPALSFTRSVILVRAGRSAEGYAEVARLLRVPFGAPVDFFDIADPVRLLLKDDPHYDELINHPPRL